MEISVKEELELRLPEGVVLIRKERPPDGVHALLGQVQTGYVYSVDVERAAALCADGEFVPARRADHESIAAWEARVTG